MSELIQIKKQLTMAEIAQVWWKNTLSKVLETDGWDCEEPPGLKMCNPKYCVVGEAHGWSSDYNCPTCSSFSGTAQSGRSTYNGPSFCYFRGPSCCDQLRNTISEFEKHWNSEHVH